MASVLSDVDTMPMLGVCDSKDEIDHRLFFRLVHWGRGAGALGEYARPIGKRISDWGAELPEEATEVLFEGIVDVHVLV